MRSPLVPLLAILVLWCQPSHADELQDRIKTAIEAYRDTFVPQYMDISLRRAQILIDDSVKKANPSEIIKSTDIGGWITRNQPDDILDPALRKTLVETLSGAFRQVMKVNTVYATALAPQDIRVAELQLRITTAIDDVVPGPSRAEQAALDKEAGERLSKVIADEHLNRRIQSYKRLMGLSE